MTAQVPEYDGCPWPVDPACQTAEWDAYDDAVKDRAVALASSTLERLTARRVGNCPITVRPCHPRLARGSSLPYFYGANWQAQNWDGVWINACGHVSACGCDSTKYVALPAPVGRLDEVKVDGQVVPVSAYRLDSGRYLVRMDGEDWPVTQDLTLPDTEPGTFSDTYLNAYPVDSLGAYAVGVLAMEFAKACSGSKCRLPAGVTSISRQGITMEIPSGVFPGGMTGIREVDSFIALWNPNGSMQSSRVWSPDRPSPRVTT